MKIAEKWLKDIPQQFLGKKKIETLIKAFSRQMQEIQQVFDDLYVKMDVDKAFGRNLDYVGTIIPLSRKEAGVLVNKRFQEPVISDERYRQYLKYKMLQNTSECTYYDIMKAIEILWDVEKASYFEREGRPATVFIGLPLIDISAYDYVKERPDILKPAGVALIYVAQYGISFDHRGMERVTVGSLIQCMVFPFFSDYLLDGNVLQKVDIRNLFHGCRVKNKEAFDVSLISRKNYWTLDGSVCLDGSRKLNAKITEEGL